MCEIIFYLTHSNYMRWFSAHMGWIAHYVQFVQATISVEFRQRWKWWIITNQTGSLQLSPRRQVGTNFNTVLSHICAMLCKYEWFWCNYIQQSYKAVGCSQTGGLWCISLGNSGLCTFKEWGVARQQHNHQDHAAAGEGDVFMIIWWYIQNCDSI